MNRSVKFHEMHFHANFEAVIVSVLRISEPEGEHSIVLTELVPMKSQPQEILHNVKDGDVK